MRHLPGKRLSLSREFGEVGIDGGFLKDAGIQITEMNSGCICCSLVGDLVKTYMKSSRSSIRNRILIEPSGVGKLSDDYEICHRRRKRRGCQIKRTDHGCKCIKGKQTDESFVNFSTTRSNMRQRLS